LPISKILVVDVPAIALVDDLEGKAADDAILLLELQDADVSEITAVNDDPDFQATIHSFTKAEFTECKTALKKDAFLCLLLAMSDYVC
jgi:hypothetical protein